MTTALAFVVALAVLIAVHEYGHYKVARLCGVKVLEFSIGFGPRLFGWKVKGEEAQFAVSVIPLGGFVRMLDEREAPVEPHERHLAFNTQALYKRVLIVLAGPVANLLLAVVLFAGLAWYGANEPRAVLSVPATGTLAANAGITGQERVTGASIAGGAWEAVDGFEQLRWLLTKAALQGEGVELELKSTTGANKRVLLPLDQLQVGDVSAELYRQIGITAPWSEPVIGELQSGGAALRDGLQPNDRISRLNDLPVLDAASLRQRIRESGVGKAGRIETQRWLIDRPGVGLMELAVTPDWVSDDRGGFGRIGAYVGKMPDMVWVSYPLPQALDMGLARTWDMSALTLRMMGRILTGQASIKNLTGPISIAEYAGKSAQMGLAAFLGFLGVISVSLGVLNLLPIPMLDGGHLMYYLWEWLSGKPVPEPWLDRLQRAGLAVVLLMMSVALFNDVARLLG